MASYTPEQLQSNAAQAATIVTQMNTVYETMRATSTGEDGGDNPYECSVEIADAYVRTQVKQRLIAASFTVEEEGSTLTISWPVS